MRSILYDALVKVHIPDFPGTSRYLTQNRIRLYQLTDIWVGGSQKNISDPLEHLRVCFFREKYGDWNIYLRKMLFSLTLCE